MRRVIVRAAASIAVLSGATIAFAFSTGPPAIRTNAFPVGGKPQEPNCTMCHTFAPINTGPGMVEILDVPPKYVPGQSYPLRIRLTRDHPPDATPKWGFQIQAIRATNGDSAGYWMHNGVVVGSTFDTPSALQIVKPSQASILRHRRYLEHGGDADVFGGSAGDTASVFYGSLGPVEWNIDWVAPTDSVTVYFFVAGNAANGDGMANSPSEDYIFTDVESTVVETSTVGVPAFPPGRMTTYMAPPYPNPFRICLDLSFEIARAGTVDISIYDLLGRKIRTVYRGFHAAGIGAQFWDGNHDNGRQARNGIYFVKFMAPGLSRPQVHKITLAN